MSLGPSRRTMTPLDRRHLLSLAPLCAAALVLPGWAQAASGHSVRAKPSSTYLRKEHAVTDKIYASGTTALLMVDPYSDFMTPGGKAYEAIRPTAEASGMFDNLRKLIPAVRSAGMQVFIVPHHRSHEGDHDHWRQMTSMQTQPKQVRCSKSAHGVASSTRNSDRRKAT